MSDDAKSSQGFRMPSAARKPGARRYEKPTLVKTDNIIAIAATGSISPPV